MSPPRYLTGDKAGLQDFIDKFDVFLFDCDGVLWSGDQLFEGTAETIDMLRSKGKKLVFVTNNSTKSRKDYAKKFLKLGITVSEEEVFGSSYSAAIYISRILTLPSSRPKVFVVGESGIEQELASEQIPYVCGTDPAFRRAFDPANDFAAIADGSALDPQVGCVLIGLDFNISYLKLAHALAHLQRGATFVATNVDSTLPAEHALFPGAGSIGAGIVKAAGKEPLVMGKPNQTMMDAIEGKFKLDKKKTCMVGDRLDTDIKFGIEGGLGGTLMVLTGVSQKEEIIAENAPVVPLVYVDKLGDLLLAK